MKLRTFTISLLVLCVLLPFLVSGADRLWGISRCLGRLSWEPKCLLVLVVICTALLLAVRVLTAKKRAEQEQPPPIVLLAADPDQAGHSVTQQQFPGHRLR